MNKKLKKQWIAGLESGEYKQCRHMISREDYGVRSYCALGVLLEIINKTEYELNTEELGLSRRSRRKIIKMNDHQYKSFKEIARWIKWHVR